MIVLKKTTFDFFIVLGHSKHWDLSDEINYLFFLWGGVLELDSAIIVAFAKERTMSLWCPQ